MSHKILITRPVEHAQEFARLISQKSDAMGASSMGKWECVFAPLLSVGYPEKPPILPIIGQNGIVIVSSSYVFRPPWFHGYAHTLKNNSFICVGKTCAESGKIKGIKNILGSYGTMEELCNYINNNINPSHEILYLRGKHVSQDVRLILENHNIKEIICYNMRALDVLPEYVIKNFVSIDVVTIFSKRTGEILSDLIAAHDLDSKLNKITLVAISPQAMAPLMHLKWRAMLSARSPNMQSMLEIVSMLG